MRSQHIRILNESWPLRDSKGHGYARGIPDQPNPIPIRVLVVWEGGRTDGEWINGTARRWTFSSAPA